MIFYLFDLKFVSLQFVDLEQVCVEVFLESLLLGTYPMILFSEFISELLERLILLVYWQFLFFKLLPLILIARLVLFVLMLLSLSHELLLGHHNVVLSRFSWVQIVLLLLFIISSS